MPYQSTVRALQREVYLKFIRKFPRSFATQIKQCEMIFRLCYEGRST